MVILLLPFPLLAADLEAEERSGCNGVPIEKQIALAVGRGDTLDQLQQKAEAEAERQVLEENCGSFVASTTRVDHAKVVEDSVVQASQGLITSIEVTGQGAFESQKTPDGKVTNLYKVSFKVGATRMPGAADPGFTVSAKMDKGAYNDGDAGRLTVWLSQPSYLYIFNIGSDGSISILFPNRLTKQNLVGPAPFMFPTEEQLDQGQKLRFAVAPGQESERVTEYMEILATKRELRGLEESPIREAINRPLSIQETAPSTELGKLLLKSGLRRDEIATSTVAYEIYRKPNP